MIMKAATKYVTRNQVQIIFKIKCIEDFEVILTNHLVHSIIIA